MTSPTSAVMFGWLLTFLGVGLLWRLIRYFQGIPFWGDEAYQLMSILHQDYSGLLREPLEYGQVAPLLFIWVQRFMLEQFGGGEYAMRLVPIIAGIAALLLFARFAWLELPPRAAALAVAVYAVSYRIVRHNTETKPYVVDGFVAVLLLWAARGWWRAPDHPGRSTAIILAGAIGVWLSYPAVFLAGAIGFLMLAHAIGESRRAADAPSRRRAAMAWAAIGAFGLLVGGSFLAHYLLFAGPQSARASGTWLEEFWTDSFPPAGSLLESARWLVDVHTGRMLGYPVGGALFTSSLTTLCCLFGLIWLVRQRNAFLLGLTLLPAMLTLVAAALHKYPYGGASRLSQHLAPLICLTAGAGVAALFERVPRQAIRERLAGAIGLVLLGIGLGGVAIDCVAPYRTLGEDESVRPIMRDVVDEIAPDDVVVCFNTPVGTAPPADGPRFDPVARYYLELYRGRPPIWLAEQSPPPETRWVIAYVRSDGVPTDEHLRSRIAESGLRVVECRSRRLSERWQTGLIVCRVEPDHR